MSNVAKMKDVLNPPWARIAARQRLHPVDNLLGGTVAAHQGLGRGAERALCVLAEVEAPSSRRAPALRYVDVCDVSYWRYPVRRGDSGWHAVHATIGSMPVVEAAGLPCRVERPCERETG
jgi:hypothetical protein